LLDGFPEEETQESRRITLDQKTHKSVHLASFPMVICQVEVFDSWPARALALATSGQARLN
jgi:hypothetical protein